MRDDQWTAAIAAGAVSNAEPAVVMLDGDEIAVWKVGDEYFATSNICTHGFARLADGYLDGFLIECPLHQGLFDIRNGHCQSGPVDVDLASYNVRVADGMVEVRPRG